MEGKELFLKGYSVKEYIVGRVVSQTLVDETGAHKSPFCKGCGASVVPGLWGWCPQLGEYFCPSCVWAMVSQGVKVYSWDVFESVLETTRRYFSFLGWFDIPELAPFSGVWGKPGKKVHDHPFDPIDGVRVVVREFLGNNAQPVPGVWYLVVSSEGWSESGIVRVPKSVDGHKCGTSTAAVSWEAE